MEDYLKAPDQSGWLDALFDPGHPSARSGWSSTGPENQTQYAVTDTCAYLAQEMLEQYSGKSE